MHVPAEVKHLARTQILSGALTFLGMTCLWLCWGSTGIELLMTQEIEPNPDMDAVRTRDVLSILLVAQLLLLMLLGGARIGMGIWLAQHPTRGRGVALTLGWIGVLLSPLVGDLAGFVGGLATLVLVTRPTARSWFASHAEQH